MDRIHRKEPQTLYTHVHEEEFAEYPVRCEDELPACDAECYSTSGVEVIQPEMHPEWFVPIAPDGGWSWVVLLASVLTSVIIDGIGMSIGMILVDIADAFGSSASRVAIVGSLFHGCYQMVGPLVASLINVYNCRTIAIFGSIMASMALFLSSFMPSVELLVITVGILGGTSFGFIHLPTTISVNVYFNKKRALANGLAVIGSPLGSIIFGPIINYLLRTYFWANTSMIFAGLLLNCIAFGCLYRPLKPPIDIESLHVLSSTDCLYEVPITVSSHFGLGLTSLGGGLNSNRYLLKCQPETSANIASMFPTIEESGTIRSNNEGLNCKLDVDKEPNGESNLTISKQAAPEAGAAASGRRTSLQSQKSATLRRFLSNKLFSSTVSQTPKVQPPSDMSGPNLDVSKNVNRPRSVTQPESLNKLFRWPPQASNRLMMPTHSHQLHPFDRMHVSHPNFRSTFVRRRYRPQRKIESGEHAKLMHSPGTPDFRTASPTASMDLRDLQSFITLPHAKRHPGSCLMSSRLLISSTATAEPFLNNCLMIGRNNIQLFRIAQKPILILLPNEGMEVNDYRRPLYRSDIFYSGNVIPSQTFRYPSINTVENYNTKNLEIVNEYSGDPDKMNDADQSSDSEIQSDAISRDTRPDDIFYSSYLFSLLKIPVPNKFERNAESMSFIGYPEVDRSSRLQSYDELKTSDCVSDLCGCCLTRLRRIRDRHVSLSEATDEKNDPEDERDKAMAIHKSNPGSTRQTSMKKVNQCLPKAFLDVLCQIMRVDILKNRFYVLALAANFFSVLGILVPFIFVSDLAQELDIDIQLVPYFLSILAASSIITRLILTTLISVKSIRPYIIQSISQIFLGLATMVTPLCSTFWTHNIVFSLLGIFGAPFWSFNTLILYDLVGLDSLTSAIGIVVMVKGVASIIGAPLAGLLLELSGGYSIPYAASGVSILISGILYAVLYCLIGYPPDAEERMAEV